MTFLAGDVLTAAEFDETFPTFIRKTADEPLASTTIANDSELTVALDASCVYDVDAWIVVNASAAVDWKVQWSTPSGVTGWWSVKNQTLTGAAGTVFQGAQTWAGQGQVEGSASDFVVEIFGVLVTDTTPGSLTMQWAPFAAGTATVKTNSRIKLTKHT